MSKELIIEDIQQNSKSRQEKLLEKSIIHLVAELNTSDGNDRIDKTIQLLEEYSKRLSEKPLVTYEQLVEKCPNIEQIFSAIEERKKDRIDKKNKERVKNAKRANNKRIRADIRSGQRNDNL